jgi:hypothetical protein
MRGDAGDDGRRCAVDHVAPQGAGRGANALTTANRDERPHTEGARQRAAAHQVTEAAPRSSRRSEEHAQVSGGSH